MIYRCIGIGGLLPYDPDRIITNQEMARAATRLASEEYNLIHQKFPVTVPFQNDYAKDLALVGKCIGQDKVNEAFLEQQATHIDTVASLAYCAILKAHSPVSYGTANQYYTDVPQIKESLMNTIVTFAYQRGIQLYSWGKLYPLNQTTHKDVAAILLQLDEVIGLQSEISTEKDEKGNNVLTDRKILKNIENYPQSQEQFACILKDIPAAVYTTPFEKMPTLDGSFGRNPKQTYDFAREYSGLFLSILQKYTNYVQKQQGIELRFTYIPSLVCDNESGYTLRVKCEIVKLNGKALTYEDVFSDSTATGSDRNLYEGMTFYVDAVTDYTMGTGVGSAFSFGTFFMLDD